MNDDQRDNSTKMPGGTPDGGDAAGSDAMTASGDGVGHEQSPGTAAQSVEDMVAGSNATHGEGALSNDGTPRRTVDIYITQPPDKAIIKAEDAKNTGITIEGGGSRSDGSSDFNLDVVDIKLTQGNTTIAETTLTDVQQDWSWTAKIENPSPGDVKIRASTEWTFGANPPLPAADERTITIQAIDTTNPDLKITRPAADDAEIPMLDKKRAVHVTGTAVDPEQPIGQISSGVDYVDVRVEGLEKVTRATLQSDGLWSADVEIPGRGVYTLIVKCADKATVPNIAERSRRFVAVDDTDPVLTILSAPPWDQIISGTGNEVVVLIEGTAADVHSGVQTVRWRLDGGEPADATPVAQNWSSWNVSARIQTPEFGAKAVPHTITIWCIDGVGRQSTKDVRVRVERSFNAEEPTSLTAYLATLLDFTTKRVKQSELGPLIEEEHLAQTFHQAFGQIRRLPTSHSDRPVNQLRLCIEILRRYLGSAALDETHYRETAYQALLRRLGTSYEEIRLVRGGDSNIRQALADRLNLPSPDQLDELFLPPDAITEANLERLFGYAVTTTPKLDLTDLPTPAVLMWQLQYLQKQWTHQDQVQPWNDVAYPIIDPDLIGADVLRYAVAGNPAFDLWESRWTWIDDNLRTIRREREEFRREGEAPTTPLDGFQHIVALTWDAGAYDKLLHMDNDYLQGNPIEADLTAKHLSLQAFVALMHIHKLAKKAAVLTSEWDDLYAILVQVLKVRAYSTWRDEERAKNITLGPDFFRLPPTTQRTTPVPWRATARDRQLWLRTLQVRITQQQSMIQGLMAAVDAAEETALPLLRDALREHAGTLITSRNVSNWLTQRLLIDVRSSSSQVTTRLKQAIETLQSILFALRNGRFTDKGVDRGWANPAAQWNLCDSKYTETDFDREWQWMGTYATWRAAMQVFYHPENLLLPHLRDKGTWTGEFKALIEPPAVKLPADQQPAPPQAQTGYQPMTPERAWITITQFRDAVKNKITVPLEAELSIIDDLPNVDRVAFGKLVKTLAGANAGSTTLQELFYHLPIHLALQLQEAGAYTAALDWFQTVYAYNLPDAWSKDYNVPKLLRLEQAETTSYQRESNWLLHSLNPHDIVPLRAYAYTRATILALVRCLLDYADAEFTQATDESIPKARVLYMNALDLLDLEVVQPPKASTVGASESPPPNPVVQALRQQAEANLTKLRNGRNIAGMQRQIEVSTQRALAEGLMIGRNGQLSTSTPTLRPTPYYFSVLIERSKHLVGLAQQIEAGYLAALERRDGEVYNLLKARQDLHLAAASVKLQDLRKTEADENVTLATRQKERAETQRDIYQAWLLRPISAAEQQGLNATQRAIDKHQQAGRLAMEAAQIGAIATAIGGLAEAGKSPLPGLTAVSAFGSALAGVAAGESSLASSQANAASVQASLHATKASYERRAQEWTAQKQIAEKDAAIGEQQETVARAHVNVATQEQALAQLQQAHAEATVNFLAGKFTNADLYAWMGGVLGRVYRYFLQQATAMAKLAQDQLAFERQEAVPSYIQTDYWQASSSTALSIVSNGNEPDRGGLTGSARLLQDIYQVDQYAFETNKRKLQVMQTCSLAQLAPVEFEQFRETGVLPFATPMELFDRAFPGHYVRLIKRVRTSVIALIPPVQGIRATLTANGISRVVVGGDVFETTVVRRNPEMVALTSPSGATGVFELDPQSEMLLPFEGMGVDTAWEFQMPKAANAFDYRTMVDVLITIEYTALHSPAYRQQVIESLNPEVSADRSFSFRQAFPDQWYALNNPDHQSAPLTVRFTTTRDDFPPNVDDLTLLHLVLYFVRGDGVAASERVEAQARLRLWRDDKLVAEGEHVSQDQVMSTRRDWQWHWKSMNHGTAPTSVSKAPVGEWELTLLDAPLPGPPLPDPSLPDPPPARSPKPVRELLEQEMIEDILFVITYSGRTPAWPV